MKWFWRLTISTKSACPYSCDTEKHVGSLLELGDEDAALTAHIMGVIQRIAKETGVDKSGFRVVVNTGTTADRQCIICIFIFLGKKPLNGLPVEKRQAFKY